MQTKSIKLKSLTGYVQKTVQVASDPASRQKGLSGATGEQSMLFEYDKDTNNYFHMKDMNLDLDIAWFNSTGQLLKKGSYNKDFKGPIICPTNYRYVLEAPKNSLSDISSLIVGEEDVAKKFNTASRKKLASEGDALPDGSFPVTSLQDLSNAMKDWGRSNDDKKPHIKRHLLKRAKALGASKDVIDVIKDLGGKK